MKLDGKIIVITGGGSGMGREMSILFAKEGARVVIGEWNDQTLAETVETIRAAGGEVTGLKTNVAVQAEDEALIETALNTYGRIDVLVNNAGVMDLNQGVGEMSNETYERVVSINIRGPLYLSRRAVQEMKKQGKGVILNIASVAGVSGAAAGAAYTISKHALVGLTRSTAWMYAKDGIRCNAILAGGVKTNITASVDLTKMDPAGSKRTMPYIGLIPAFLEPIDIANLALFLVSDDSRFINGADIPADGGWLAA
jgi:NAD(P)-dependent dehydrogenase (short-subunit alcohol dehydrogenase family)